MLHDTSTPAASNGAAMTPSATLDDEIIPVISGVTLIDADSDLVARRLRHRSWADRAQYLNNIVAHSIFRQVKMLDHARSDTAAAAFGEWALIEMGRRIGEVLDLWGPAKPVDADAVALYLISLKPAHRRAAQAWMKTNEETPQSFDRYLQEQWPGLAALAQLSAVSVIDLHEAWQTGPRPCLDSWFKLPGYVA